MDSGDAAGVTQRLPIALTIAGSDSGGGAGIQADLKTFAALGVYGASVVTALTAQNTRAVRRIHFPSPEMVADQIERCLRTSTSRRSRSACWAARRLPVSWRRGFPLSPERVGGEGRAPPQPSSATDERRPSAGRMAPERAFIVYDPVMIASSGDRAERRRLRRERSATELLPLVDCLTPNLAEAAALLGEPVARSEADMARQGEALLKFGPRAVLMKGGHLDGDEAVDLLVTEDTIHRFAAPRLASKNLHGTGCTLSSAIAANIVLGARVARGCGGGQGVSCADRSSAARMSRWGRELGP